MIIIVNNSCKPIDKTTWNLKVKYIMEKLIGKQKVMVIDNTKDMIKIISTSNIRNKIKGIILSGSELSVNNRMYIQKIMNNLLPIVELNVPILGICFGYQILCTLYKGSFNSFSFMRIGNKKINISNNELFKGVSKKNLEMYVAHRDYSSKMPILFKQIAADDDGINYGIKHKYKPIYGILFHPEFSNETENSGMQIFKNFLSICQIKYNDISYDDVKEINHPNSLLDFSYLLS